MVRRWFSFIGTSGLWLAFWTAVGRPRSRSSMRSGRSRGHRQADGAFGDAGSQQGVGRHAEVGGARRWIASDLASPTLARCGEQAQASMKVLAVRPPFRLKLNTPPQPLGRQAAARGVWSGWLSSSGQTTDSTIRAGSQMGNQCRALATWRSQAEGFDA